MNSGLLVIKPGVFASIQDLGRFGYQHLGVPISGAMDLISAQRANLILGNDPNAPLLEVLGQGGKYLFQKPVRFVLTGGDLGAMLNGKRLALYRVYDARADDLLIFKRPQFGNATYLAVRGGFQFETVMGSHSQCKHITATECVSSNQALPYSGAKSEVAHPYARLSVSKEIFAKHEVPCYPGPEFTQLGDGALGFSFTISASSNRMATQLLEATRQFEYKEIITAPVAPGTVQLTPGGQLIVLMRDCQTTGGYPRVLQLSREGIDLLAQKRAGQSIQFALIED